MVLPFCRNSQILLTRLALIEAILDHFAVNSFYHICLYPRAYPTPTKAIDFDTNHKYPEAVLQYDEALRLFARARDQLAINDPVSAVTIAQKMEEYSARAKVLRDALAQNPFHSPAPAGQMGAPMGGGSPQVYHAPVAPMPAYVAMPQPTYNNPPPAQQPVVMNQLPVMAPPPAAQPPPNPNANKIIKTKEQGFVGHANKIKLVVGLPRYAERLYVPHLGPNAEPFARTLVSALVFV